MIPLSLYIHMPWCIQKCPYCDFNSHKSPIQIPETTYIKNLLLDLENDLYLLDRVAPTIHSIFIGGGTPSLFSATAYEQLFQGLTKYLSLAHDIEITMEVNPGSAEQQKFNAYKQVGINRLSLGIQSFDVQNLKNLGRIHDDKQAHQAIETARNAGFDNINLDLMHGLPKQSVENGIHDLNTALSYNPEHLSWYQLTIEPNTLFYKQRPLLPSEDDAFELEQQGLNLFKQSNLQRYEISAFAQPHRQSQHNLNYWSFGDYLGIGAGAHGKITTNNGIIRTCKYRQPKEYLDPSKKYRTPLNYVKDQELVFEFMLNTSRLEQPIPLEWFTERTLLSFDYLRDKLHLAEQKKMIVMNKTNWKITDLGRQYTNDLQALFLPD